MFEPVTQKFQRFLTEKQATFDMLWLIFREGCEVIFKDPISDVECAGMVHNIHLSHVFLIQITSAKYRVDLASQQCFEIMVRRIDYNGDKFYYNRILMYLIFHCFWTDVRKCNL